MAHTILYTHPLLENNFVFFIIRHHFRFITHLVAHLCQGTSIVLRQCLFLFAIVVLHLSSPFLIRKSLYPLLVLTLRGYQVNKLINNTLFRCQISLSLFIFFPYLFNDSKDTRTSTNLSIFFTVTHKEI